MSVSVLRMHFKDKDVSADVTLGLISGSKVGRERKGTTQNGKMKSDCYIPVFYHSAEYDVDLLAPPDGARMCLVMEQQIRRSLPPALWLPPAHLMTHNGTIVLHFSIIGSLAKQGTTVGPMLPARRRCCCVKLPSSTLQTGKVSVCDAN